MMRLQKIPFRGTHAFTEFFLNYIERSPSLKSFYSRFPHLENFKEQVDEKSRSFPQTTRKVLVAVLQRQYSTLSSLPDAVKENIQSLQEKNSFTVTTGHQLSIFTGPLYFIYKIVTVINACQKLKLQYPSSTFVPVYWMASEDHDYEEIKSFRLYGKQYTWETRQQGAVGKFHLKDFASLLSQLPGDVSIFKDAYLKSNSLSDAVRVYANRLFGELGLVVIDGDDPELKKVFQPVLSDDLFHNTPIKIVSETNRQLEAAGYPPQVNPREINLFYLDKNLRSRIEKHGGDFSVVDTDLKFSKKEMEKIVKEEPGKFSPNVILRPLYQEMILPNVAYVGGPAELVYWLQLKPLFENYNVPFPVLLPRNFALVIDKPISLKLSKTGLQIQDYFEEKNYLFNHWTAKNSAHDLSLGKEMKTMESLLVEIQQRCARIDPTLSPMAKAETKRMQNAIERIEKKMLRAEKRLQSDRLRQIEAVKDALFPLGGLQERTDNFLNFYQQDAVFIKRLLESFDPFDFEFNVLSYHD